MFKYLFKLHNLYCRGSPASMDSWNYGDIMAYELREDIFQRSTAIVARNDATALEQYLDEKDAAVEEHGEIVVSYHLGGLLSDCIGASKVRGSRAECVKLLLRAGAQPVQNHLFTCRDPAIMATLLDHLPLRSSACGCWP